MIPSSEAHLYLESRQEIFPRQWSHDVSTISPGKTIAIVLFANKTQHDENKTAGASSTAVAAHAYICTAASTAKDRISDHRVLFRSKNDQLIIRFSASSRVALIPLNGDSTTTTTSSSLSSSSTRNAIDQTIEILQNAVGNAKIDPAYYITETIINTTLQANIEKCARCKIQDTTYCVAQKTLPENESGEIEVRGYVFSLSIDWNGDSFIEPNRIPTPLLSISLVQTDGRRLLSGSGDDSKVSPSQALLHQCLKRLMVGNLLVCPVSDSGGGSMMSPSKVSTLHNDDDSGGTRTSRSVVSLQVPSLKGSEECFSYKVNEVLPHFKTSRGIKSNIFIILPSTRITLIHPSEVLEEEENEQLDDGAGYKVPPAPIELSNKPPTEDLILLTIDLIRHYSLFRLRDEKGTKRDASYSVDIPRAFLLSGPPGVGKTYAVRMAVEATNAQKGSTTTRLISIRGSEILSSGANEADAALELKRLVMTAVEFASKRPENVSVLFMDECDALLSSDVAGATLAYLLDQMTSPMCIDPVGWKRIVVIAATNRIDAIPSSLRRPGRFDRELCISPPNKEQRYNILASILRDLKGHGPDVLLPTDINEKELAEIAELCVGYVAADLSSLVRRAAFLAIKEGHGHVNCDMLRESMKEVGASALRDSAIHAPPTTRWDDIAGDAGGAKVSTYCYLESIRLLWSLLILSCSWNRPHFVVQ